MSPFPLRISHGLAWNRISKLRIKIQSQSQFLTLGSMLIEHFIQKLSFYLTENTVPVYYKDQLVSASYGKTIYC